MKAILIDKLALYQALIEGVERHLNPPSPRNRLFVSLGRHPRGDSLVFEFCPGTHISTKVEVVYVPQPGPIARFLVTPPDGSTIFLRVLRDQRQLHSGQSSISIDINAQRVAKLLLPQATTESRHHTAEH